MTRLPHSQKAISRIPLTDITRSSPTKGCKLWSIDRISKYHTSPWKQLFRLTPFLLRLQRELHHVLHALEKPHARFCPTSPDGHEGWVRCHQRAELTQSASARERRPYRNAVPRAIPLLFPKDRSSSFTLDQPRAPPRPPGSRAGVSVPHRPSAALPPAAARAPLALQGASPPSRPPENPAAKQLSGRAPAAPDVSPARGRAGGGGRRRPRRAAASGRGALPRGRPQRPPACPPRSGRRAKWPRTASPSCPASTSWRWVVARRLGDRPWLRAGMAPSAGLAAVRGGHRGALRRAAPLTASGGSAAHRCSRNAGCGILTPRFALPAISGEAHREELAFFRGNYFSELLGREKAT